MRTRYEHLAALIAEHKPSTIVEIGVHRGARAVYMVKQALEYQEHVEYRGFDVFETESMEFQEAALNGKGLAFEHEARRSLKGIAGYVPDRFKWNLHIGKTSVNLHPQNLVADFVFIDGDHRADVIKKDYEAVKGSRVVVFDDYYRPDEKGKTPDLTRYGANLTVDAIPHAVILEHGDPTRHTGLSHIAVVVRP